MLLPSHGYCRCFPGRPADVQRKNRKLQTTYHGFKPELQLVKPGVNGGI